MNILLITDSYPPEIRSASHLMEELALGLKALGHTVVVVTSYPQYNLAAKSTRVFREYEHENGIDVVRIKTLPHHNVNFLLRGIAQLFLPYIFFNRINKYVKNNIDGVIVYSPPLPLAKAGALVKRKFRSRYILNVQDLFPQNAIDLGILKNRFMINFFEKMEKEAYNNADVIAVHSEGNSAFLVGRKNVSDRKVSILHNWVGVDSYSGIEKTGYYRKAFGLENKFVFLFAGVIGPSQGLDLLLRAAKEVESLRDIVFLIVGDGSDKKRLMVLSRDLNLANVRFIPFISKEEYPRLLHDVDVGLVSLSCKNKTPVVPGKILGYMAASLPVVAFLNKESDGHALIKHAHCGYSVVSENVEDASLVLKMAYGDKQRLKEYGANGQRYVRDNFDKNIIIKKLESLFLSQEAYEG